jgi:hypothetical protein
MARFLIVKWLKGKSKNYSDELPVALFKRGDGNAEHIHAVLEPHGRVSHARFRMGVSGSRVTLDYRPFEAFNEARGMELGVLELNFPDETRSGVPTVRWDGKPVSKSEAAVRMQNRRDGQSGSEDSSARVRKLAKILARPRQAIFRKELDLAYGGKCCITGCPIPAALQAAHIAPFAGRHPSDAVTNGLLLRADLHMLFDQTDMAVRPKDGVVFFSDEVRIWGEYAQLHGKVRLFSPQPGYENARPDPAALKKRWDRFVREHGRPKGAAFTGRGRHA